MLSSVKTHVQCCNTFVTCSLLWSMAVIDRAGQHQFHFYYDILDQLRPVLFWLYVFDNGFEWYFQSDWAASRLTQVPHRLWSSFYFFHKTGQIYLLLTLLLIAATFLCIAETGLNDFQLISLPPGYWFSFRRQRSSKPGPLTGFSSISDHGRMKVQPKKCWETIPLHLLCSVQHTVSLELWKPWFAHRGNNFCRTLSRKAPL